MKIELTNESGFYPIEDRVLVKLIEVETKSAGGIALPDMTVDAEDMAQIHGYYVAGGVEGHERMTKHGIEIGKLIVFSKYAGNVYTGKDGKRYRIMNAEDVIGTADSVFDTRFRSRKPMNY